jgi:hypothetical protein
LFEIFFFFFFFFSDGSSGACLVQLVRAYALGLPIVAGELVCSALVQLLIHLAVATLVSNYLFFIFYCFGCFIFIVIFDSFIRLDLLLSLPLDDPRCTFVQSTLQQCIDLSYFDRIVKTLPDRLVASPLMPGMYSFCFVRFNIQFNSISSFYYCFAAKPVSNFRYASPSECSSQSYQYASELLRLLSQKAPWESVWLNVQIENGLTLHERVDILVQV